MRNNLFFKILIIIVSISAASVSQAVDLMVNGSGKAPITADIALTRESSLKDAKRNAVLNAIKKINGADAANDPKIIGVLDDVVEQIGNEYIFDQSTSRDAANNFLTTLKLKLDDKEFRKLISDHGIAVKTANTYPILVVMDEFFTTPTDNIKPLREVVEMFSDKSSHLKQDQSSSNSDASSASSSSSGNLSASSHSGGGYSNNYAQAHAHSSGSVDEQSQASGQQSNNSSNASSSALDDSKNDVQSYKKMVEYQPQNTGPSDKSYTYEALLREAASFDLNIIDNSLFRSKYFTGKPLTLQELTNGRELASYVQAAFEVAKADFFMAGSTIIYDLGKNSTSGLYACDGVVTMKAYSTTDGKVLAADARTESASGNSPDQCRVNVANKMAAFTAGVLGHDISEYWKNRNMYGRQYTVQMVSLLGQLNFQTKKNFGKVINTLKGVKEVPHKRAEDANQVEYSLQYTGETPIGDAIGELVSNSEVFKNYPNFDVRTLGSTVRICLEASCPSK